MTFSFFVDDQKLPKKKKKNSNNTYSIWLPGILNKEVYKKNINIWHMS